MKFLNRVSLETPESVELEFSLAGIGNRAYALIVDYVVLGLILFVFTLVWSALGTVVPFLFGLIPWIDRLGLWFFAIWLLVTFLIYVGYFVFFETLWRGQTPGKRRVKIRVIRDDGKPVRLQEAALRTLLRPVDEILFIGVFLILLSRKEKRLGDWLAGTLVIQEEGAAFAANFKISERGQEWVEEIERTADIYPLTPDDFAVIRDYLQRRDHLTKAARKTISQELATQIKNKIAMETIPPEMTATQFLEACYLIYQKGGGYRDRGS
ncbi:MAG: RDD family protein [Limnospira sp.]